MSAPSSLSSLFHNSSGDESVLTSFWLSHYLVFQLLFLRHSLFDLQPSANRRRGEEERGGASAGWAGLVASDFQHPGQPPASRLWTAGRRLLRATGRFYKKSLHLHICQFTAPTRSLLPPPWLICWGGVFLFPSPSVESSRVLTALSLRLQVDFSPLLVFLFPADSML